jgi:hypothetical protein
LSTNDPITLTDGVDVVTSVPTVLGFHPSRALVAVWTPVGDDIPTGVHVRLPMPQQTGAPQVHALVRAARTYRADRLAVVIVDDQGDPDDLPHNDLVDRARAALNEIGVHEVSAYWTSSTRPGGTVRDYADPARGGTLPDVTSDLRVRGVLAGQVVFNSREEIVALFQPDSRDVIERRHRMLSYAVVYDVPSRMADQLALVLAAIQSPPDPGDDHRIVQLGLALREYAVRDVVMATSLGEDARRAEHLWFVLVRGLPAPERAEAAVLIAVGASVRGDGALANIALDAVDSAMPRHRFASFLRSGRALGMPAEELPRVLKRASEDAMAEIEAE